MKLKNDPPGHTGKLLVAMPRRQYELFFRSRETKGQRETGEAALESQHQDQTWVRLKIFFIRLNLVSEIFESTQFMTHNGFTGIYSDQLTTQNGVLKIDSNRLTTQKFSGIF